VPLLLSFADPLRSNRMLSPSKHFTTQCPNQRPHTLTLPSLQPSPDGSDSLITRSSPCTRIISGYFLLLPSHVCKHLRDIALSTPALWTNIVLHVTNETFESRAALASSDYLVFPVGKFILIIHPRRTRERPTNHGFSSSALQPLAICQPPRTI